MTSMPSMSGMTMSSRTTSGRTSSAFLRASSPVLAVTTRKPSSRSAMATSFVMRGSSSATRTRGCVLTVISRVRAGRSSSHMVTDGGVGSQVARSRDPCDRGRAAILRSSATGGRFGTIDRRWSVRRPARSIGSSLTRMPPWTAVVRPPPGGGTRPRDGALGHRATMAGAPCQEGLPAAARTLQARDNRGRSRVITRHAVRSRRSSCDSSLRRDAIARVPS